MSARFDFKLHSMGKPIWTLGGRWVRPRPIVVVGGEGPSGSQAREALVDCGADDTVFPLAIAEEIGIDLDNAPSGEASTATQELAAVSYAEVTLRLANHGGTYQWPAKVGFTNAPLKRPLLGFAGCLQFFTTTMYGEQESLVLEPNNLFPGTVST